MKTRSALTQCAAHTKTHPPRSTLNISIFKNSSFLSSRLAFSIGDVRTSYGLCGWGRWAANSKTDAAFVIQTRSRSSCRSLTSAKTDSLRCFEKRTSCRNLIK